MVSLSWILYGAAIVLRCITLTSPGYIHPDEVFQSIEVMLASIYKVPANIPWEYHNCSAPTRSPIFPYLIAGLPYQLWNEVTSSPLDPFLALVLPRISMLVMTFIVDLLLCRIATHYNADGRVVMGLLCSSWAYNIMMLRPFSNSTELFLVVVGWYMLIEWSKTPVPRRVHDLFAFSHAWHSLLLIAIAMICVVAVFNRFTYVLYGAAFALGVAQHYFKRIALGTTSIGVMCVSLMFAVCAALAVGAWCVRLDIGFYNHHVFSLQSITPWNSLRYNSDPTNLAVHGIHPRYQHLLVNGFIMFGPLWLAPLVFLIATIMKRSPLSAESPDNVCLLLALMFLPLLGLSVAPHQEPRFLLPHLPVVALMAAFCTTKTLGSSFKSAIYFMFAFWLIFNILLGGFFGYAHQAGVLPATISLSHVLHGPVGKGIQVHTLDYWGKSQALQEMLTRCSAQNFHLTSVGSYMLPHTVLSQLAPVLAEQVTRLPGAPWCTEAATSGESRVTEYPEWGPTIIADAKGTSGMCDIIFMPGTLWEALAPNITSRIAAHTLVPGLHISTENLPQVWTRDMTKFVVGVVSAT